ncbi:MAG: glycosyltransferase family 25 protein [Hyphomicrobiaceae bacterium]
MRQPVDAEDALRRLPSIPFDGSCRQAAGIDLPVAVINLPHRTDRWEAVTSRMAAVGLDKLIKVPAVAGASLSLAAIAPILAQPAALVEAPPASHFTMTRPAIGCFLSHLAVWRWIIDSNLPHVLVLEDDAYPAPHFDAGRLQATVESMTGTVRLLLACRVIMNGMAERPSDAAPPRIFYFNSTAGYLITPAACRFLMQHLLPMNGHIDHQISRVLIERRHEFAGHYLEPSLFEPDWSLRSDVYIPLHGETEADRVMGRHLADNRALLLADGYRLLDPS